MAQVVCRFYSRGNCKFGHQCNNLHEDPSPVRRCIFYQAGKCIKGNNCSFSHSSSDGKQRRNDNNKYSTSVGTKRKSPGKRIKTPSFKRDFRQHNRNFGRWKGEDSSILNVNYESDKANSKLYYLPHVRVPSVADNLSTKFRFVLPSPTPRPDLDNIFYSSDSDCDLSVPRIYRLSSCSLDLVTCNNCQMKILSTGSGTYCPSCYSLDPVSCDICQMNILSTDRGSSCPNCDNLKQDELHCDKIVDTNIVNDDKKLITVISSDNCDIYDNIIEYKNPDISEKREPVGQSAFEISPVEDLFSQPNIHNKCKEGHERKNKKLDLHGRRNFFFDQTPEGVKIYRRMEEEKVENNNEETDSLHRRGTGLTSIQKVNIESNKTVNLISGSASPSKEKFQGERKYKVNHKKLKRRRKGVKYNKLSENSELVYNNQSTASPTMQRNRRAQNIMSPLLLKEEAHWNYLTLFWFYIFEFSWWTFTVLFWLAELLLSGLSFLYDRLAPLMKIFFNIVLFGKSIFVKCSRILFVPVLFKVGSLFANYAPSPWTTSQPGMRIVGVKSNLQIIPIPSFDHPISLVSVVYPLNNIEDTVLLATPSTKEHSDSNDTENSLELEDEDGIELAGKVVQFFEELNEIAASWAMRQLISGKKTTDIGSTSYLNDYIDNNKVYFKSKYGVNPNALFQASKYKQALNQNGHDKYKRTRRKLRYI